MKSLLYAGYMAVFMVGATLVAAGFVARHVVTTALIEQWAIGFAVIFVGGLMAARTEARLVRPVILAMSAWIAWAVVVSVMAFWPRNPVGAGVVLSDIMRMRTGITLGAVWGLILAAIAEVVWHNTCFARHRTSAPQSRKRPKFR